MFKALLNFEKRGKIQIKPVFTLCQTLYWQSESSVKIQGFPKSMWYPKLDPKTEKNGVGGTLVDVLMKFKESIVQLLILSCQKVSSSFSKSCCKKI